MSQYITAADQALMFIQNLLVDGWVSKSACFLDHEDILYPDFDHDHRLSLPLLWHAIVVSEGKIYHPKGLITTRNLSLLIDGLLLIINLWTAVWLEIALVEEMKNREFIYIYYNW